MNSPARQSQSDPDLVPEESLPHSLRSRLDLHPISLLFSLRPQSFASTHSKYTYSMFSRFSQLARHLSRPLPKYAHSSAASLASTAVQPVSSMTSSATFHANKSKTIHTAACLIIGDEVLGGKVIESFFCSCGPADITRFG